MKKTALVLAAVLALTSPVWAQWKIGVGGSFGAASPMCDVFAEVTLNEALGNLTEEFQGFNVAIRCNLGTMVSDEGVSAFTFDATALVPLSLEMIQAYFGAGAGAGNGALVADEGAAEGFFFTVNGIAGVELPLDEVTGMELPFGNGYGVYGQVRFLGQMVEGGFNVLTLPGAGLYVNF